MIAYNKKTAIILNIMDLYPKVKFQDVEKELDEMFKKLEEYVD